MENGVDGAKSFVKTIVAKEKISIEQGSSKIPVLTRNRQSAVFP